MSPGARGVPDDGSPARREGARSAASSRVLPATDRGSRSGFHRGIVARTLRPPTPDGLRALVRPLDDGDQRILSGLIARLMRESAGVRDRGLAERSVRVPVVAHGLDLGEEHATSAAVAMIERYARARMAPIVNVAITVLVRTAEDPRERAGRFAFDRAQRIGAGDLEGA